MRVTSSSSGREADAPSTVGAWKASYFGPSSCVAGFNAQSNHFLPRPDVLRQQQYPCRGSRNRCLPLGKSRQGGIFLHLSNNIMRKNDANRCFTLSHKTAKRRTALSKLIDLTSIVIEERPPLFFPLDL